MTSSRNRTSHSTKQHPLLAGLLIPASFDHAGTRRYRLASFVAIIVLSNFLFLIVPSAHLTHILLLNLVAATNEICERHYYSTLITQATHPRRSDTMSEQDNELLPLLKWPPCVRGWMAFARSR